MRILVTGSSGFVGRALMSALERAGHEVKGVSRSTAAPNTLQIDLLDAATVRDTVGSFRPDLVYHLAAKTALTGDSNDFQENVTTTQNLIDAISTAPSVRRVVWMSSQLVNRPGTVPDADNDYDPPDSYGASKAASEEMIRNRDGGGKPWVIVRSTTIWGPGMSEHYAAVIRMIARGAYFHLGWRPLYKSYSYIDNLASQLVAVGTAPAKLVNGRTLYLADSEPIELHAWTAAFGKEFNRRIHTMPVFVARAFGKVGDLLTRLGARSPITSKRVRNMLTEYVYPTGPIETIHGPTAIPWQEGVRRTADWVKSQ